MVAGAYSTLVGAFNTLPKSIKEVHASGTNYNKEDRNKRIVATLEAYTNDLNNNKFDAYKYFSSEVELFFTMTNTRPKEINKYVNGLFREQFKDAISRFDKTTMMVKEIDNSELDVTIIMYSTYYNVKKKKQYIDFRTRTELKFDADFRIKYFRQFFD